MVQLAAEIAGLNSMRFLLMECVKDGVRPASAARVEQRIVTATACITRDTAQHLEPAGLSSSTSAL